MKRNRFVAYALNDYAHNECPSVLRLRALAQSSLLKPRNPADADKQKNKSTDGTLRGWQGDVRMLEASISNGQASNKK
jgi:hypothetical protein